MLAGEKSIFFFPSQWAEGHLLTCGAPWNLVNAQGRVHELLRSSCDAPSLSAASEKNVISVNECISPQITMLLTE